MVTKKCIEIETLRQNHDDYHMHKKIEVMQNFSKQRNNSINVDKECETTKDHNGFILFYKFLKRSVYIPREMDRCHHSQETE